MYVYVMYVCARARPRGAGGAGAPHRSINIYNLSSQDFEKQTERVSYEANYDRF